MTISFSYNGITMFKPGNSVNETMNEISIWSGSGADRITRIARYKGNSIPNSLTDDNIVSTISSEHPIYMWYDDGTIYWYSEAEHIYYNFDAGSMFKELPNVQGIYDMNDIYSIYTENMEFMFHRLGSTASTFDLDLGDNFYTKNVYNMNSMFQGMASNCLTYGGIDLGPNFDTSKVTQMNDMFSYIRVYTIHAPTTFVTTNVVASNNMFYGDTRLVGGAGTQYTPSHVDALYAHIDEGTSNPGYFTNRKTAMFKSGKEVNARMKQFVNSSATYSTSDTTIQKIWKVPQQPAPQFLISENIVSTPDSQYPIYMWYTPGSSSGWLTNPSVVNWWTEADLVFYNPDSSFFYYNLFALDDIAEGWIFNSKYVTNMSYMFSYTGYNSTSFTLDLGDRFDTSKVTNMNSMFFLTGYSSTNFTLDLGDKFDTSNVTNMSYMFKNAGYSNTSFTLDLGDKFDTSNVTNMSNLFYETGFSSTIFTLDLGTLFNTSNVTNMESMFREAGYSNTSFTLDLGDKFDTSNVTNMAYMFSNLGKSNTSFTTLDLGALFNTSKVTNMNGMFYVMNNIVTIYAPTVFTTGTVTNSTNMFTGCTNLVGGLGTVYNSSHIDKAYAHIDGGTNNPGYFSAKGAKYATFYYNSNTSSGGLTVNQISTYCIPTSGTSCTVTIPSEVTSSMGKYNSPYKGVSTSTGNMNSSSLAISDNTTFYANYSKQVTNYYYNSGYTSRVIYRNEYFTSTSAMESRLATSNTSISNYSTAVGPGSSVWSGLSTGADTTSEYTSVQAAANSNTANLYTVYTFNVAYAKGANVSSIGATSGSCTVTSSNTSCSVTLPTITANTNYGAVGWNTTNGATSGTAAGASYTLSNNGTTLYGNAARLYTCPTSRTPASYNYGSYQTSKYGSYQDACQSRTGANSECGSRTVCGSEYSDYECHVSWEPDCGRTGPHYNADRDWYYYCGYSNQTINNSCTSYRCPNSVATWNYTYGIAQFAPYGDYQDQCV